MTPTIENWTAWERRFETFLERRSDAADPAHDLAHVRRVVAAAKRLAAAEDARPEVVVPAAWLHDCVTVPKDSPRRSSAAVEAAAVAGSFLLDAGYPATFVPAIRHAIEAHSFSAGVTAATAEARVVRDADRLDALGAIGIARCFMVGGALDLALHHPREPFPRDRQPDDSRFVIDHFYVKLLKLAATMQTSAGRAEARRRSRWMEGYLDQLRAEIAET